MAGREERGKWQLGSVDCGVLRITHQCNNPIFIIFFMPKSSAGLKNFPLLKDYNLGALSFT